MESSKTPHLHADGRLRARLRWRCRRGMKELDLLLERFLERGLESLNAEQLTRFETLLEHPDQDLVDWIGAGARPQSAELADIVRCIRSRIGQEPMEPASDEPSQ